jgi:hypothetical protein
MHMHADIQAMVHESKLESIMHFGNCWSQDKSVEESLSEPDKDGVESLPSEAESTRQRVSQQGVRFESSVGQHRVVAQLVRARN